MQREMVVDKFRTGKVRTQQLERKHVWLYAKLCACASAGRAVERKQRSHIPPIAPERDVAVLHAAWCLPEHAARSDATAVHEHMGENS